MITRLTFASRLGLIVVLSLIVAWLGATVIFYLLGAYEDGATRPLPPRIVALVKLVEAADNEQRATILQAVESRYFEASIERDLPLLKTPKDHAFKVITAQLTEVLAEVGGRSFSVTLKDDMVTARHFATITPSDLELRVKLRGGETLVVQGRHTPVTSIYGLPIGFFAGLIGTLTGLLALTIMHRETRPLARLAAAVDQVDFSGVSTALPEARSSAPEIRAVIAAFNRLQSRLAQLLRARMAMLGGISHDVRTFATRLRLRVDHIPEGVDRERAIADIADMIRLLDDALLASRAGAGELNEELVEFDQVVRAEVDDRRAESAAVELECSIAGADALVIGDRLALRRVVANLIDNALQYGAAAHVRLEARDQSVVLTVDDDGPGIPPEEREHLLEPFVRLETSRNRRTGGAGLGLAVVRNLVEAHAGAINIGDAPGRGARFAVSLPLFKA